MPFIESVLIVVFSKDRQERRGVERLMSRVVCIYQFANPITNENSTYLGILLFNNKLQAVMPYLSDFYTFTLLRQ